MRSDQTPTRFERLAVEAAPKGMTRGEARKWYRDFLREQIFQKLLAELSRKSQTRAGSARRITRSGEQGVTAG